MTPERWAKIERLFHKALEYTDKERAEFLDQECVGDWELRREVESLFRETSAGEESFHQAFSQSTVQATGELAKTSAASQPKLDRSLIGGRYRLKRLLGSGGMGTVYEAVHVGLQRPFALKLLKSNSPLFLNRFRIEAEALGRLKHPHIVDVSDFGTDAARDATAYLVMEYLKGQTLSQHCQASGPLPVRQALPLLETIAEAIDYAHEHGILHGDLKPDNVFLCESGVDNQSIKILDFGLARFVGSDSVVSVATVPNDKSVKKEPQPADDSTVTEVLSGIRRFSRAIGGTPGYMAPELFRGEAVTVKSDLYAFGVLIYEILVGRLPLETPKPDSPQPSLTTPSHAAPWLPKEIDAALLTPLHENPSDRPPCARAIIRAIRAGVERAELRLWRKREFPRRIVISCVLSLVVTLLSFFVWQAWPFKLLEAMTVDVRFRSSPTLPPDPRILIVSLDEASLNTDRTYLPDRADEVGRQLERIFQVGARGVAVDLLLPAAWSQSQAFSQMVLRRADALALAAVSTAEGVVVGPECLSPLTVAALGAERVFRLFAFVNVGEDEDGITRRGYLGFRDQAGLERKAFAARAAELIGSSSAGLVSEGSRFWIDHSVDFAQFEKLSWKDLTEALDRRPSLFKDRLVIVGAEFAASGDEIHRIPATSSQPAYVSGLGLQSMMVHTILNGLPVRELPASSTVVFLILVTATVGAGLLCCGRLHFAIFLLAAGALLWVSITVLFFLSSRTVIPIAGPVLTMVIAGGTGLILRLKLRGFPKGESI